MAGKATDRNGSVTMEAKIIALAACCRELFLIMDMVSSVTDSVKLPIGQTTTNVSMHEDNSRALVLEKTLPPQFTVGVYIVMVCRWTDHILARNPFLEVEEDLPDGGDFSTRFSLIKLESNE